MAAASGSNAPIINDALVAWPPPPSRPLFDTTSPPQSARSPRFSLAAPAPSYSGPFSPIGNSLETLEAAHDSEPDTIALCSPKGKERAPPLTIDVEYDGLGSEGDGFERRLECGNRRSEYGAAPRRPLTPVQLGRIAQSFGIMSPNVGLGLPSGSSGDASVSSPIRSATPSRSIPLLSVPPQSLVAVVPPANLLPADDTLGPAEQRERLRRFRRGRLLPLQPTHGAMLTTIAREFGLPSTLGVNVYLGPNWSGDVRDEVLCSRSSASACSDDDGPGPLITPHTWPSLVARTPRSPSSVITPSTTPRKVKGGRSFGVTSSFSSSPLTAVGHSIARAASAGENRPVDESSPFRASQGSSSASSFSPRTPGSSALSTVSQNPIFGTIEFDIDPSEARWLPSWLKNGGPLRRRVVSDSAATEQAVLKERDLGALTNAAAAAGIRNLTLVERLKDERPKFLRDMEERERARERAREAEREAKIASAAAAQRAAEIEERRRHAEEARMEEEARLRAETEAATAEEEERRRKDMEAAEEERRRAEEERRLEIEAAAAAAAAAAVEEERRRAAAERAVEEEERRRREAEAAEQERIRAEEERRIAIEAASAAAVAAAVEEERRRVAAERAAEEEERRRKEAEAEEERKREEEERRIAFEASAAAAAAAAVEQERRRVAAERAEEERQRAEAERVAEEERKRVAAEEAAEAERQRIVAEEAAEAERKRVAAEEAAEAERAESVYSGSSISQRGSLEQQYAALSDGESTYSASPETTTRTLDDPMDDLAALRAQRERSGPLTELDIGTSRALEGPVPEAQEKVPPSTSQDSLNEVVALLNVVDANPEVLSDPTLASPKPDQPATEVLVSPEIDGPSPAARSVSSPLPQPHHNPSLASPFAEDSSRLTSPTGYPTRSGSRALAEFPVSPGDSSLTSPATPGGVSPNPAALPHLRTDVNDNRASGQVMEDQLNNLERMMRDLSPRELEFTESLPVPNKSPETWVNELPPRGSSRLPYLQPDDARLSMMSGTRAVSAPTQHRPRPSLASSAASPPMARVGGSPGDALSRFPAAVSTPSPGMVIKSPGDLPSVSSGVTSPAPPRPARPPTPDLTGVELAPHHLPAGLAARVDKSPSNPPRARPNSISLRGIKRTVSKSVLRPQRTGNSSSGETIGIFPRGGPADLPPSSFASVRPESLHPREGSGDAADDSRIRSRLFSFGGRRRRESGEHVISHISSPIAASHKHVTPAELVAAAPPAVVSALNPASHTPRETPTTATSAQLFAPLPPTPGQLNPPTLPASGSSTSLDRDSLNSPSSPRNVRRKPVPSIEGGSTNSHSEPDPISV